MIHKYYLNGFYILLDINSGAVHVVDKMIFDILDVISLPLKETFPDYILKDEKLKEYNKQDIIDGYNEILYLKKKGQLFSDDQYEKFASNQFKMPLKAMCLNVAHDCNLRCKYCFASTGDFGGNKRCLMPFEVGKRRLIF